MATPTEDHWRLALGVVRYLSVTPTCGLTYGEKGPELTAYCDADYAGDVCWNELETFQLNCERCK
jgi:hypothetical protein